MVSIVVCICRLLKNLKTCWLNSVDRDQTAPVGAVCSGSTLFTSTFTLVSNVNEFILQTT